MKRRTLFLFLCCTAAGCSGDDTPASADTEGSTFSQSSTGAAATGGTSVDSASATGPADGSSSGDIEPMGPSCQEDLDGDQWPHRVDNATSHFNPGQLDRDDDDVGDVVDLCVFDGGDPYNTADSDNDGVGNSCDRCWRTTNHYNVDAESAGAPAVLLVRGNPYQRDSDGDGIADPCDNCVTVANCQGFGADGSSYQIGDSIDDEARDCQEDANSDFVGDACEGLESPNAAGPVGLAPTDDFDQDGLSNAVDGCPRIPLPGEPADCTDETAPEVCGPDRVCIEGLCGHVDSDGDGFGNICDTCPEVANPEQLDDGDDEDGDFIGSACETGAAAERENAPPLSFAQVSVLGVCCTTELLEIDASAAAETGYELGDLIWLQACDLQDLDTCRQVARLNPDIAGLAVGEGISIIDVPVRRAEFCSGAQVEAAKCAVLPEAVAVRPGVLVPPVGCEGALDAAGISAAENRVSELVAENFADEPNPDEALWMRACRGPVQDQDFDGLPDQADTCLFSFDPTGASFVDMSGMSWPNDGAACNGAFVADNVCDLRDMNR